MRLALKFTFVFLVGMCVIQAISAYFQVQREAALFEADMKRDHAGSGRELAGAVSVIWSHAGEEAAFAVLGQADESRSNVQIRWVWLRPPVDSESVWAPKVSSLTAGTVSPDSAVSIRWESDDDRHLVTYAPVSLPDGRLGAIELSESLREEEVYIRTTVVRIMATTGLIVLATGAMAVALGLGIVARPVRTLIQQARRVAAGDLTRRPDTRRTDELGALARELNAMCDKLAEAERQVAEESRARERAAEQLRHAERLSMVGKLTSSIAHELGTPLNVILARARMLTTDGAVPGQDADECAQVIIAQTQRMTKSIQQILQVARRKPSTRVRVDLRHVAERTASLLAPLGRQQGVEISLTTCDSPAIVEADPDQIHQVLSNLVMNAVQAMSAGGRVQLQVGVGLPGPGLPRRRESMNVAWVSVRDNGPGIPGDSLPRIFEPFFTSRAETGGTGLGLSIVLDIVESHGGWIDVDSEVGRGTTFLVSLPRKPEPCEDES